MTTINTVTTSQGSIINLAMASNQDAINVIEAFRNSHSNQVAEDREAMQQLTASTRKHVYILVGAYCGIADKLLDPANEAFLVHVLGEHGLSPALPGYNPYLPLANMLFGEWKDAEATGKDGKKKERKKPANATATRTHRGKKQFFVPNRSAEKYAKVARYAYSQGWSSEEVAAKLSDFKGGLTAVVNADTIGNKATDEAELNADHLVDLVYESEPHSTLDLADCGLGPQDAERKLVSLWAEITDDGEVLIRGVMPTSEDALNAYVRKYAKANSAKLLATASKKQRDAKTAPNVHASEQVAA